jgi:predicted ester cyclase
MSKVIHVTLSARAILPTFTHSEPADVTARNEEIVRANLEKINRGDARGAAADWAELAENFGRPIERADVETVLEDILATFPDYHMDVVEMVAAADAVVVRCNVTGTHRELGVRNKLVHINWYTLRDGKIVQRWATRDDDSIMRQLALTPSSPPNPH